MAVIKVGDKFTSKQGCEAVVIAYNGSYNVRVRFLDEHGCERTFAARNLRSGLFKNPYHPSVCGKGYIGVGEHKSITNGKPNPIYLKWNAMINRVYSEKRQKRDASYIGCEVCEEWLNFQNFATWHEKNEVRGENLDVDKDLMMQGNKIYSPETCVLVPHPINMAISKTSSSVRDLPQGVYRHQGKYSSGLYSGGERVYLGSFPTPEEAHAAYVVAKEAYVKEVAEKWKGKIDPRVYDALMSWRVNP